VAEAIGSDIAAGEQREIRKAVQLDLPVIVGEPIPVLYVQMDGTGVPVVKKETAGRKRFAPASGMPRRGKYFGKRPQQNRSCLPASSKGELRDKTRAAEMPGCGRRGNQVQVFPSPSTSPWKSLARFPHSRSPGHYCHGKREIQRQGSHFPTARFSL
jgi:hypothetical protein